MKNKADILNELSGFSPVLFHLKENERLPMVPEGYFDGLADALLSKKDIFEELKSISSIVANAKLYEVKPVVPENYFHQFANTVIAEIQQNKIFSPVNKKEAEVPAGYFESFADNIIAKIRAEENIIAEGKIIPLPTQRGARVIRLFSRVAVAAALAGVIFVGIKNIHKTVSPVNDCGDGIACLTQEEIYNYMNVHSHEFDVQQVQEAVQPMIENTETKIDINKKEATQYIEQNKNVLDVDDASTDIF